MAEVETLENDDFTLVISKSHQTCSGAAHMCGDADPNTTAQSAPDHILHYTADMAADKSNDRSHIGHMYKKRFD